MKALVYTANQQMQIREEAEPVLAPGEALVSIAAVGICGSDMHAYLGHDERRVPPLILGHEAAGRVVDGPMAGQRVVLNPLISCGHCDLCLAGRQNLCAQRDLIGMYRPGAFAERIAMPIQNLISIPDHVDDVNAALTEPGATGLHAITLAERTLHRPISESRVLVIGGGSVGLLTALLLKDKGVSQLTLVETNALRRATITAHTDIQVSDPIAEPIAADSYDLIFDAVGNSITRQSAMAAVQPGGSIVHIGLLDNAGSLDVRYMTLQEITFIGCYTYSQLDMRRTLDKIASGALGDLQWVERRPLEEGADAFSAIHNGQCAAPKVVLSLV